MEFMELANERRSVRAYRDRPVDRALVDEIIRACIAGIFFTKLSYQGIP